MHVVLQAMEQGRKSGSHSPFFISLVMIDLLLHNCMLDPGASTNIMPLKIMNQLGLEINRPYGNVCGIDSSKAIKACGLIKDLKVTLASHTDISILMDVVVIDVPDAWRMLLSRGWAVKFEGNLQMDLSYATIPTKDNTFVILHNEQEKKYHVEDPRDPMNEQTYEEKEFGCYLISLVNEEVNVVEENEQMLMSFDEDHSKPGFGSCLIPDDLSKRVQEVEDKYQSTSVRDFYQEFLDFDFSCQSENKGEALFYMSGFLQKFRLKMPEIKWGSTSRITMGSLQAQQSEKTPPLSKGKRKDGEEALLPSHNNI